MAFPPQAKVVLGIVIGFLLISATYGAPASEASQNPQNQDLADQIAALQKQLTEIQNTIGQQGRDDVKSFQTAPVQQPSQFVASRPLRSMAWQPMKRMVAWQPMKRSDPVVTGDFSREQLIRAIERQLSDVLHAGETLGISAEDVLNHLRQEQGGIIY